MKYNLDMKKRIITILFNLIIIFLAIPLSVAAVKLNNPINASTPEALMSNIIKVIIGVTGANALFFFVYGGFLWMISAGNPEKVKKGKDVFLWATIGLIVIFSSYVILKQVFEILN